MNGSIPRALIYGIDHFVAKKLALELSKKEIDVTGVGEDFFKVESKENFRFKLELEDADKNFNYVFDFAGEKKIWEKAREEDSKLVIVCVDNKNKSREIKTEIQRLNLNWRLVESYGVYGPEMDNDGFLAKAIEQAVQNKNLILPSLNLSFRLLNVNDLVEAILRASFLSGTDKEMFLVLGEETNSEDVAGVLIEEAKMTRNKVVQEEIKMEKWDENEILTNRKKLRWKPEVSFREGIQDTLQYFFSKIDEESRRKKAGLPKKNWEVMEDSVKQDDEKIEKKPKKKVLEVVIEEEEIESKPEMKIEMEPEPEPEPKMEIKKFPLKHSVRQNEKKQIEIIEEDFTEQDFSMQDDGKKEEEIKISKKKKINFGFIIFPILIIFAILVFFVPLSWAITNYSAYKNIFAFEKLVKEKKYEKAQALVDNSLKQTRQIDEKIDNLGLNRMKVARNYQIFLKTTEDVLSLESESVGLIKTSEKMSGAIFNNKEINWKTEIQNLKIYLSDLEQKMGLLQARLNGNWNWLPGRWRQLPQKTLKQLDGIKAVVSLSDKVVEVLPEFLGLDGKKREYMVLLQNENELRPGGGFIGSYAILSFQGGKLLSFEIKDVYDADGQLKGHVEPPEEIKNYLGEAGWFMRDANWSASFLQSSKDIQWFLEKELNRKVDGVIGVDLAVIKSILDIAGEVYVPDFNEKISKDNLYEQAEFYAETKFFPGSKQKASFLGGLGKQLFEEIRNLKADKRVLFYSSIIDLLERNEIQVSLNNKQTAKILNSLGWDGSLYQGKCNGDKCFADYLYLVESNLGVNKANYFLYRNIEQAVEITSQSIKRNLKINYENMAKTTAWPGGDYKNYLRIYVPEGVSVEEASITDRGDPNSKKILTGGEIKINDIDGKREIGFLVMIPVNSKRTVEIKYSNQIDLSSAKQKFSYLYYIQRQPGSGETGLVNLISFPSEWQPTQVQPEASLVRGKLLFNQKLEKDIKMGVELGK